MSTYNTVYDFCKANRVEVTADEQGTHNCYINFDGEDMRPWGSGSNILDAIDNGVINYLRYHSQRGFSHPAKQNQKPMKHYEPKELISFFNTDGTIFWYWFARKYNMTRLIDHYEQEAVKAHPDFLNQMRYLIEQAEKTIENPDTKLYNQFPAIHNTWIQSIVYYESIERQIFENNKLIMTLIEKTNPNDQKAFNELQKFIAKVDEEIQKIDE